MIFLTTSSSKVRKSIDFDEMGLLKIVLGLLCSLLAIAEAKLYCGVDTVCYGDGAYCCGIDDDICCWYTPVYQIWWFWFVWFWVFVLIMSCSCWLCVRRRRQRAGYIVVGQPTYGSAVTVTPAEPVYGTQQYSPYTTANPTAPSYMAATQKQPPPPPYTQ